MLRFKSLLWRHSARKVINGIDRLGQDYIIVTTPAFMGVDHVILIGDDGNGGHFRLDFAPDVPSVWRIYRRICGMGMFEWYPAKHGSAEEAAKQPDYTIVRKVKTTPDFDKILAETAKGMDGKKMTYCVIAKDCRYIEDYLLNEAFPKILENEFKKLLENLLKDLLK
jgi:hypothetical protein